MARVITRRLLTVEQAAEYVGMAAGTLYNQVAPKAKRKFPVKPIRLDGKVRFDVLDLDAYIDSLKKGE